VRAWHQLRSGRPVPISVIQQSQEVFFDMLATKYKSWKYEDEVRLVSKADTPEDGRYFLILVPEFNCER
jgi:hypothetical protein